MPLPSRSHCTRLLTTCVTKSPAALVPLRACGVSRGPLQVPCTHSLEEMPSFTGTEATGPRKPRGWGRSAAAGQPFPPATTRGHLVHTPEGTGSWEVRESCLEALGCPAWSQVPPSWGPWALGTHHFNFSGHLYWAAWSALMHLGLQHRGGDDKAGPSGGAAKAGAQYAYGGGTGRGSLAWGL